MFDLVHASFDTLDVAFQGALPAKGLAVLAQARDNAADRQEPVLATLGPGNVAMHVSSGGMRGGYAFVADTGPLGAKWFFKNNGDPTQWNIFVSPRATALLAHGYFGIRDHLTEVLTQMGVRVIGHSINRVDFALDFSTSNFELAIDQFIAHPHTKVRPHWSKSDGLSDPNQPNAVFRGRRLESVTVGKMPGRQIIVYDKRREAVERQKLFWFRAWGIDQTDPDTQIWRVEIRAGKKELKNRWNIRHFDDLEAGIGDVCHQALRDVRYVAAFQTDTNVTRQALHPLWSAAQEAVLCRLVDFRSGLVPGQIVEIERELAIERYASLVIGNAVGLGIALGLNDEDIVDSLPGLVTERMRDAKTGDPKRLQRTIKRARERLYFVRTEILDRANAENRC